MTDYKEVGEVAYSTFCTVKRYTDWKSWEKLPETEKDIWREVAREVFRKGWQEKLPPPSREQDDNQQHRPDDPDREEGPGGALGQGNHRPGSG